MSIRNTVALPADAKNIFGPKLKALRLSAGLSIKDAAAQLQTGRPVWNLSETGLQHLESRRRAITDAELLTLLKLYSAKLSDLEH